MVQLDGLVTLSLGPRVIWHLGFFDAGDEPVVDVDLLLVWAHSSDCQRGLPLSIQCVIQVLQLSSATQQRWVRLLDLMRRRQARNVLLLIGGKSRSRRIEVLS